MLASSKQFDGALWVLSPCGNSKTENNLEMVLMVLMFYTYQAKIDRVVDGDTLILEIDLGFHLTCKQSVRLLGLNAPEMHAQDEQERIKARNAREFVQDWCNTRSDVDTNEWPFAVSTSKSDSFGRWLGHVWSQKTGESLNMALLEAGHAKPYQQKGNK
jgi:micrococcal nuclease